MRIAFLACLCLSLLLSAPSQRKIIVASFPSMDHAEKGLYTFNEQLDPQIRELQSSLGFEIKVRPSGTAYILVLEPFTNIDDARLIKALLPSEFFDAFINRYTPPQPQKKHEVLPLQTIALPQLKEEPKSSNDIQTVPKIEPSVTEVNQTSVSFVPKISTVLGITPPTIDFNQSVQKPIVIASTHPIPVQKDDPTSLMSLLITLIFICIFAIIAFLRRNWYLQKQLYDSKVFEQQKISIIDALEIKLNQKESFFNTMIDTLTQPLNELEHHIQTPDAIAALNTIKENLTSYTQLRGTIHLATESFDLNTLLHTIIDQKNFKIPPTLDIDTKLPREFLGDPNKLTQIIHILSTFIESHTNHAEIYLGMQEVRRKYEYTVVKGLLKTSGEGFEKEVIDIVQHAFSFEDTQDIHAKELVQLIIAKRFLKAMEGSIKLNLQGGKGTGFVFEFTLENPKETDHRKYRLPDKSMLNYSVLIADNNILAIGILRRQLEYFHMDVKPCFSWEQAYSALMDTFYFVDLCFIQAELVSAETLEVLLALKRKRNFALAFIINDQHNELYETLKVLDEVYLLVKPYTQDTLLTLLTEIHQKQKTTKLPLHIE